AKNLVAAGLADKVLVQVSYAIGVSKPVSLYVNTYGGSRVKISDGDLTLKLMDLFDLRPAAIIKNYKLDQPIFEEAAAYGNMGRTPGHKMVDFGMHGKKDERQVETFTW